MRNNLFRKYFGIFSLCIILSITVLGVVLLVFGSQYFQNEKYEILERNARQAALITEQSFEDKSLRLLDKAQVISAYYAIFAVSIDAEIFLTDRDGNVLYRAGVQSERTDVSRVPATVVEQAAEGKFEGTGTLGGFFPGVHYVVAVPMNYNGQVYGILFATSSAEGLKQFLVELAKMFVISAGVVLFISFVLIYFITSGLVRPLKDMLRATQSFSAGDFTMRVPVSGYDEIGQLAMAFNNMASSLAATESTRRTFVANVSHELKTPMTTIGGFVDGILDGTIPEEKHTQYLHVVSNEVKRLSRLVRSMLDTARIETGELELHYQLFDISETIRQTVFTFEKSIEEKHLAIHGLEADKVMLYADEDLMHQVVYNLVENAVKFVNAGGVIEVGYRSDNQRTYVAIRNSGEGIEKSEVPLLFERFYKSDRSRGLNKNGVGLGLHIVKSIVNYHQGEIFVRSELGAYTEFEFCIPNPPKKIPGA